MMKKLSVLFFILYIVSCIYLWVLNFTTGVDMTPTRFIIEFWFEYLITTLFLILHFVFKFLDYN